MPEGERREVDWVALREQLRPAAIAAVVVFNLINAYAISSADWDNAGVRWLLLDSEGNAATWFSSVTFLLAGVCALGCGLFDRVADQPFWTLVGALLVIMSVEEVAQLHELISGNLSSAIEGDAVAAIWVIPATAAAIVVAIVLVRIAPPLDPVLARRLIAGSVLFVIGAFGFELLTGELYPEQGSDLRRSLALSTIEENLEMAGGLVLAWATSDRLLSLQNRSREPDG